MLIHSPNDISFLPSHLQNSVLFVSPSVTKPKYHSPYCPTKMEAIENPAPRCFQLF